MNEFLSFRADLGAPARAAIAFMSLGCLALLQSGCSPEPAENAEIETVEIEQTEVAQPEVILPTLDSVGEEQRSETVGPFEMRGLATVTARASHWDLDGKEVSHVQLEAQDSEHARVVASKYVADIEAYSVFNTPENDPAWNGITWEIADAGTWIVGLRDNVVHVLSSEDLGALRQAAVALDAQAWQAPERDSHPKYLDNFDNRSVSIWWESGPVPPEIIDWAKEREAILNLFSGDNFTEEPAFRATNLAPWDQGMARARLVNKPYRAMLYAMVGPKWWIRSVDPRDHYEAPEEGVMHHDALIKSDLYQAAQSASPEADAVLSATMFRIFDFLDKDQLMALKIPPGEWGINDPAWVPPNAETLYREYLQETRGYTLEQANQAHGMDAASWEEFPYPKTARFFGRRGDFVDLDRDWKWRAETDREQGLAQDFENPDFSDADWLTAPRHSLRLLGIFNPANPTPLWGRTTVEIPERFFEGGKDVFLYAMPYTQRDGRPFFAWVNGVESEGQDIMPSTHNRCTVFNITELAKPGENSVTVFSNGGRIKGHVWITNTPPEEFPFTDQRLSQQWLDWMNFLHDQKLRTVEFWLQALRAADPDRPIKIMTGWGFQSDGQDLYEKYGAYIQLTGQGAFFRPMHYKGYSRLRGLPTSGEGGSPAANVNELQRQFGWKLWEGQDAHDYVFNIVRDFWPHEWKRNWWTENETLVTSVGQTDFPSDQPLALLRDVDQTWLYMDQSIWTWDISRGIAPSAGICPILVDGRDMDKGYAKGIPVVFDTATRVMSEERVDAILDYVKEGGTFVANFDTGQNSPFEKNAWPLAKRLGLTIEEKAVAPGDFRESPVLPLTFTEEQTLMPSLKGKTIEGMGISIDHEENADTGAIALHGGEPGKITPIAFWEDGSMAICEIQYGDGRIIWLGTPFFFRAKDDRGVWVGSADRQKLFNEFITSLGVPLEISVDDQQMWVSRRESKNGLYDVYFAAPMQNLPRDWKIDDTMVASFTIHDVPANRSSAFEMTDPAHPEIAGVRDGDDLSFRDLEFRPYLVRQLAVVRDMPGFDGPLHWLKQQSKTWRALEMPDLSGLRADLESRAEEVARQLGQDGLNLHPDWKVRKSDSKPVADDWHNPQYNDEDWEAGSLGTWMARGWDDVRSAQYRRTVEIPDDWRAGNKRVQLGFEDVARTPSRTGIQKRAKLWINGVLQKGTLSGSAPFVIDVTEQAGTGSLQLALEVEGEPSSGGPGGVFYLRVLPVPADTLSLNGDWTTFTRWIEETGAVSIPGTFAEQDKTVGFRRSFELPAGWEGKTVHLVVEQARGANAGGAFLNHVGYFRETPDVLGNHGVRVDQWLRPGANEIDVLTDKHYSRDIKTLGSMQGEVTDIRLEMYE